MDDGKRRALLSVWRSLPEGMRFRRASETQLQDFESEFGPIPAEFRSFLADFGGGVVGSEWIDGIRGLRSSHRKFRKEFGPPRGWTMSDAFVIGWDGAGNPMAIDRDTGKVLVEDHNFGGIHEVAASFESMLIAGLSQIET